MWKFYNCTERKEFEFDEEVEIIVNPAKIQNIPEGFNYVCLVTDIWRKQLNDSFILFPEQCFYYKSEYLWRTRGLTPTNDGIFSLLKVNVYPDSNKDIRVANEDQEGTVKASDQFIIFNLEAKIFKE